MPKKHAFRFATRPLAAMFVLLLVSTPLQARAQALPDPDGQPADMQKPVQVYILMGQSNMLGFGNPGKLQGIAAEKYPYLVDDDGKWTQRKDVRNVFIMTSGNKIGKVKENNWLSVVGKFGPEIGIGHHLGEATEAPVLILKSCIGNRSLGWDLLPPGSEAYAHDGKLQPGYRGTPDNPTGDTGGDMSKGWYAGCQYDGDVSSAKHILDNLDQYYPGATEYEVKGFFWWQGDKDMRNPAHFNRYGQNLVQLIRALRKDFNAPNAPFVTASLGQTKMGSGGGDGAILDAMKAVAESDHEELKGKVGFVYTHPLSKGGSSSGHYGGNPETYMNVGEAMGKTMVELLKTNDALSGGGGGGDAAAGAKAEPIDHQMRTWTSTSGQTMTAKFISAERGRVVLELESGHKRRYSSKSFSEEDQAYIDKYAQWSE